MESIVDNLDVSQVLVAKALATPSAAITLILSILVYILYVSFNA